MAINTGYLTSNKKNDELYTPYYAVEPLIKYLPKDKTIWCPFDEEWSAYKNTLVNNGFHVISSSLEGGLISLIMSLKNGILSLVIRPLVSKIKLLPNYMN